MPVPTGGTRTSKSVTRSAWESSTRSPSARSASLGAVGCVADRSIVAPPIRRKSRIADRAGGIRSAAVAATTSATKPRMAGRTRRRDVSCARRRSATPPTRSGAAGNAKSGLSRRSSCSSSGTGLLSERRTELVEGPRQPRLDRSRTHPERRGGLRLGQVEEIPAGHDQPLLFPKLVNGSEELAAPLGLGQRLRRLGGRGRAPRTALGCRPQHELLAPAR